MPEVVIEASLEGADEVAEGFRSIGSESENMGRQIRGMAKEIASLGASAVAVGKLGEQFGFLSEEQANVIRETGSMIALTGTVVRGLSDVAHVLTNLSINISDVGTKAGTAAISVGGFVGAWQGGITFLSRLPEDIRDIATALYGTLGAIIVATAVWAAYHIAQSGPLAPVTAAIIGTAVAAGIGMVVAAIQSAIGGLAEGAIVTKPTYALIGEKGPEAIIPLSKIMNYMSTSKNISVGPIHIYGASSPRETGEAVIDSLRRARVI